MMLLKTFNYYLYIVLKEVIPILLKYSDSRAGTFKK